MNKDPASFKSAMLVAEVTLFAEPVVPVPAAAGSVLVVSSVLDASFAAHETVSATATPTPNALINLFTFMIPPHLKKSDIK
jgi:hypothetical protein